MHLHIQNSKWIKDTYLQLDIIKLLEENIPQVLRDIDTAKDFLGKTSEAQAIKAKTDK